MRAFPESGMPTRWTLVIVLGAVVGASPAPARAQAPLPAHAIPLAREALAAPALESSDAGARLEELERWIGEFSAWKEWADQWRNRRQPGWFSDFRTRRERPDPPPWLFGRCGELLDETGAMADGCALLAVWRDDALTQAAQSVSAAATAGEQADRTIWWEHLHLDGGWPAMQSGVGIYGVIGMHATTSVKGRLEVFVAPGAMLLNVRTRDGGRAWKLATNYGIAYRLLGFSFPGGRQALLHVNLAKAWLLPTGPDVGTSSTDFVGLSLTFKK
jgi:hypothetical protein